MTSPKPWTILQVILCQYNECGEMWSAAVMATHYEKPSTGQI